MSQRSRANPWWGPRQSPQPFQAEDAPGLFLEPERELGTIPVRTDITVLPADDPNQRKLGWVMNERQGVEVYRFDDDFRCGVRKNLIKDVNGLKVGDEVIVRGMFGDYFLMKVNSKASEGRLNAKGESCGALLEFTKDDRQCWVSLALINLNGLKGHTIKVTKDSGEVAKPG